MTELATARDWLTVCQLPPYAHELNPVELVWSHLKRSLANLTKRNFAELTALVKTFYNPTIRDRSSRPSARAAGPAPTADGGWSPPVRHPLRCRP